MRSIQQKSTPSDLKKGGPFSAFRRFVDKIVRKIRQSLTHLLFPSKCLHCSASLSPDSPYLCPSCAVSLEMALPDCRCPICFQTLEEQIAGPCSDCLLIQPYYTQMAAAFDYKGPPATLVKKLKYSQSPYLARGMAGFLVLQIEQLQWPLPDAIIPVPQSWTRWLERGYNQSELLAGEIGRLLERPVVHALKRQSGDFSQAALNFENRKLLRGNSFVALRGQQLEGKVLLVVDDVMTSGLTLQKCGEILQRQRPAALYAMTFCRA